MFRHVDADDSLESATTIGEGLTGADVAANTQSLARRVPADHRDGAVDACDLVPAPTERLGREPAAEADVEHLLAAPSQKAVEER